MTNTKLRRDNTSGYAGIRFITWAPGKPWRARISKNGAITEKGFPSKEEALEWRKTHDPHVGPAQTHSSDP